MARKAASRSKRSHAASRKQVTRRPSPRRGLWRGGLLVLVLVAGSISWGWQTGRIQAKMAKIEDATAYWGERALDESDLRLANIYVEGRERMPVDELQTLINVEPGASMLSIDVHAIRDRLEASRWVELATVQQSLPSTLHVRIVERQPLALWQHEGSLHLLDREGAVIEGVDISAYSYLPVLVGETAPIHAYSLVQMLANSPEWFAKVSSALRVGERRWDIRLYDGTEILLPESAPEDAWQALVSLEEEENPLHRDIRRIDLRYPGRMYLKLPPTVREQMDGESGAV